MACSSKEDNCWKAALSALSNYEEDSEKLTSSYGGEPTFVKFFQEKCRQHNVNLSIFVPSLLTSVSHLMKDSTVGTLGVR